MEQYETVFVEGGQCHLHAADPGIGTNVKVNTTAKKVAKEQLHLPASKIAEDAMVEFLRSGGPNLPNPENVARAANLHRQKLRPGEPRDDEIDFALSISLSAHVYHHRAYVKFYK